MPQTRLLFYQDAGGDAPVWEWLKDLRMSNQKAYAKCVVPIVIPTEPGPFSKFLRSFLLELPASHPCEAFGHS